METGTAGDNHCALEHCAVHRPCVPQVTASVDDYPVPTFEAVVVTHAGTVGDGSTDGADGH